MSIDYLDELSGSVERGRAVYACPAKLHNEWHVSSDLEDLRRKAQQTAEARKYEVHIYRLVDKLDATSEDMYLIVRKMSDMGPRGEQKITWSLVDTRDAAELMRDVSHGPTPYFGAMIEETFLPKQVSEEKST